MYSLGVARWLLGDLDGAEELLAQSAAAVRRARRVARADPVAAEHRRDAREDAAGRPAGLRIVFEETLQPFVEISCDTAVGYVLANQATIARVRGEHAPGAHAARRERGARFDRRPTMRAGRPTCSCAAPTWSSPRARSARRASASREALRLRREMRDRRGVGHGALRPSAWWRRSRGDYDERRAAAGRGARAVSPRRRSLGAGSSLWRTADLAIARGAPRRRRGGAAARRARCVGETERQRWIAVTIADAGRGRAAARRLGARAALLFEQARDRYARRRLDRRGVDGDAGAPAKPGQGSAKSAQSRRPVPLPAHRRQNGGSHEFDNRPGSRGGNGAGAARGDPRATSCARTTTATPRRAGSGTARSTADARR